MDSFSDCESILLIFAHQVPRNIFVDYPRSMHYDIIKDAKEIIYAPALYRQWQYVRYDLEKQLRFDETPLSAKKKTNFVASFIAGFRLDDFFEHTVQLKNEDIVAAREIVILEIKPSPLGFGFYTPPNLNEVCFGAVQLRTQFGTEDAAFEHLNQVAASATMQPLGHHVDLSYGSLHASIWGTDEMPRPSDPEYRCSKCMVKGDHFRQFCQQQYQSTLDNTNVMFMQMPSGIPISTLRKVRKTDIECPTFKGIVYCDKINNIYYASAEEEEDRVAAKN